MPARIADNSLTINVAASGDTTLIAAGGAGRVTRVHGMRLSVAGAVIVSIKRGSTVLEVFNFAGAGVMPPLELREQPHYLTASNEALVINLSGAVQVNGMLEYSMA
jgi:hypothetical protein